MGRKGDKSGRKQGAGPSPEPAPALAQEAGASPPWRRWAPWILLVVLLGAGLFVRVWPAHSIVFPSDTPEQVRLLGYDAYFHLRQSRWTVDNFPDVQRWDHGTFYPHGRPAVASGLFDVGIATAALVRSGGKPTERQLAGVAAWTPAVLGVCVLALLYLLTVGLTGDPWWGLFAITVLLLCPGTFLERSLLGFADHHVAEVLMGMLTLIGLTHCVRTEPAPWWRPAALSALPLTLFLFTWNGAPIHMMLAALGLATWGVVALGFGHAVEPLMRACVRYGGGFLVTFLPLALLKPDLVTVPDLLVPVILGGLVLALGLPAWLLAGRSLVRRGASPGLAVFALLLATVALVAVAFQVSPLVQHLYHVLFGAKSTIVQEHVEVNWATVYARLGHAAPLAMLALPVHLWLARRRADHGPLLVCAGYASFAFALWWITGDLGYTAGPFAALLAALSVSGAATLLTSRSSFPMMQTREPRRVPARVRAFALAGLLGFLVLPLWPLGHVRPPWLAASYVETLRPIGPGWHEALGWLREHTPPRSLPQSARVGPWDDSFAFPAGTYGVLTSWDFGHATAALGERPPMASHGMADHTAKMWLQTDEQKMLEMMHRNCKGPEEVRYAIADARTAGDFFMGKVHTAAYDPADYRDVEARARIQGQVVPLPGYGKRFQDAMVVRMLLGDGSGLRHFRLVYESSHASLVAYNARLRPNPNGAGYSTSLQRTTVPARDAEHAAQLAKLARSGAQLPAPGGVRVIYGGHCVPSVKIFERVAGARVDGQTAPGAEVRAQLGLRARGTGRGFAYKQSATADEDGRFQLVLPYATGPAGDGTDIDAAPAYEITVDPPGDAPPRTFRLQVTADQVRTGQALPLIAR